MKREEPVKNSFYRSTGDQRELSQCFLSSPMIPLRSLIQVHRLIKTATFWFPVDFAKALGAEIEKRLRQSNTEKEPESIFGIDHQTPASQGLLELSIRIMALGQASMENEDIVCIDLDGWKVHFPSRIITGWSIDHPDGTTICFNRYNEVLLFLYQKLRKGCK